MGLAPRPHQASEMKLLVVLALAGVCFGLPPLAQDTPDDVPHDQCGVTAILNEDKRPEIFALSYDDQIHHKWKNHDGTWSNWVGLSGNFSSGVQAVRNVDGRIEIFAI